MDSAHLWQKGGSWGGPEGEGGSKNPNFCLFNSWTKSVCHTALFYLGSARSFWWSSSLATIAMMWCQCITGSPPVPSSLATSSPWHKISADETKRSRVCSQRSHSISETGTGPSPWVSHICCYLRLQQSRADHCVNEESCWTASPNHSPRATWQIASFTTLLDIQWPIIWQVKIDFPLTSSIWAAWTLMNHYSSHPFLIGEFTGNFPFFPHWQPALALPICSFKDLCTAASENKAVKF